MLLFFRKIKAVYKATKQIILYCTCPFWTYKKIQEFEIKERFLISATLSKLTQEEILRIREIVIENSKDEEEYGVFGKWISYKKLEKEVLELIEFEKGPWKIVFYGVGE